MSEMKEKLLGLIREHGFGRLVVDSFEEARKNKRRKNIVLLDDGIYLTFKADIEGDEMVFGEFVAWVDDEFKEDDSVYTSCINAIIGLYTYSDEELNHHIEEDDLIEMFEPYNECA